MIASLTGAIPILCKRIKIMVIALRAVDFPPSFGPVMIRFLGISFPSSMEFGITCDGFIKGFQIL